MKKLITAAFLLSISLMSAQAFKGKGDDKFSVGANFQDGGRGIMIGYDHGVAKNISIGLQSSYLLGVDKNGINSPKFEDKIDLKARFSANLADIIGVDKLDVYPGLNLGLRNFGAHLGGRYFFSDGFGVFAEGVLPIAKYDNSIDTARYQNLNNQFAVNIGAVFNIN